MKLQCLFQIGESFLLRLTLTGDVDIETLGYVPVTLSPYRRRKWALHNGILPHPLLQQSSGLRLALRLFRRDNDSRGYLIALFKVEQLYPLS